MSIVVEFYAVSEFTYGSEKYEICFKPEILLNIRLAYFDLCLCLILSPQNKIKYLGVWSDRKRSFATHIEQVAPKINGKYRRP